MWLILNLFEVKVSWKCFVFVFGFLFDIVVVFKEVMFGVGGEFLFGVL